MAGLSYLFSIIAILYVVRWFVRFEKAQDKNAARQDGWIGIGPGAIKTEKRRQKAAGLWASPRLEDE
jgi:hypothetical protein